MNHETALAELLLFILGDDARSPDPVELLRQARERVALERYKLADLRRELEATRKRIRGLRRTSA